MLRTALGGRAVVLACSLVLIVGCGTSTSPNSSTRDCPVDALTLPTAAKPALTFVLVDRSDSYTDQIRPGLALTAEIVRRAQPGERIIGAWVGGRSGQPTETFFNQRVPSVPIPVIAEPPVAPRHETRQTEGARVKADREFKSACTAYQKKYVEWLARAKAQIADWKAEQIREQKTFVDAASTQI